MSIEIRGISEVNKKDIMFKEVEDVMYKIIGIECCNQIVMKFIFHSYYDLDSTKIENNEYIYLFFNRIKKC